MSEILTIGHSAHSAGRFVELLRAAGVTALADVRSAPYSRRHPQFNREALRDDLAAAGIAYVYLGAELGGRPRDARLYRDGVADYEAMAATAPFQEGLARVIDGVQRYRVALMCAEQDPMHCHRCLLVGRALAERGQRVTHLLADGATLAHTQVEERLLALAGRGTDELFAARADRLAAAYLAHARKVAFSSEA